MSFSPKPNHHLVYSFFMETSGIFDVFEKLFKSFMFEDEHLKLNANIDAALINDLNTRIADVFPTSQTSLSPGFDQLRLNAYKRMFGLEILGKPLRVSSSSYNSTFQAIMEDLLRNVVLLLLDKNNQEVKLGDPNRAAIQFNTLSALLNNRELNTLVGIAGISGTAVDGLRSLLYNDIFMRNSLLIRSNKDYDRLREMAEKIRIPIKKNTQYLFELAEKAETFLTEIQKREDWEANDIQNWVNTDTSFFTALEYAWSKVFEKDLRNEVIILRRK